MLNEQNKQLRSQIMEMEGEHQDYVENMKRNQGLEMQLRQEIFGLNNLLQEKDQDLEEKQEELTSQKEYIEKISKNYEEQISRYLDEKQEMMNSEEFNLLMGEKMELEN